MNLTIKCQTTFINFKLKQSNLEKLTILTQIKIKQFVWKLINNLV